MPKPLQLTAIGEPQGCQSEGRCENGASADSEAALLPANSTFRGAAACVVDGVTESRSAVKDSHIRGGGCVTKSNSVRTDRRVTSNGRLHCLCRKTYVSIGRGGRRRIVAWVVGGAMVVLNPPRKDHAAARQRLEGLAWRLRTLPLLRLEQTGLEESGGGVSARPWVVQLQVAVRGCCRAADEEVADDVTARVGGDGCT
jgi:hypothetical protein